MSCWSFRGAQFNQAGVDNKKLLQQSDQTDSENDKIYVQLQSTLPEIKGFRLIIFLVFYNDAYY